METCAPTKITQVVMSCISGNWQQITQRLWQCQATVGGITHNWTEWRDASDWEDTGYACSSGPAHYPLEETQIAIVYQGSQPQPTPQRLHQYTVTIPGVGPLSWVVWEDE